MSTIAVDFDGVIHTFCNTCGYLAHGCAAKPAVRSTLDEIKAKRAASDD